MNTKVWKIRVDLLPNRVSTYANGRILSGQYKVVLASHTIHQLSCIHLISLLYG
jgi:hypothetical protein